MKSVNMPDEDANETTLAAMDATEHDKDMHGPFENVDALMEALNG